MILPDKALHTILGGAIKPLYTINWAKDTLQKEFYIQIDRSKRHTSPDGHAWTESEIMTHESYYKIKSRIQKDFYIQNKKHLLIKLNLHI